MEKISKIVTRIETQSAKQCETTSRIPSDQIAAALFLKFEQIWQKRWLDGFTTPEGMQATRRQWAAALAGLSPEKIKAALVTCRDQCDWPPSIAIFLRKAREASPGPAYRRNADVVMTPGLGTPEQREAALRSLELAREAIEEVEPGGLLQPDPSLREAEAAMGSDDWFREKHPGKFRPYKPGEEKLRSVIYGDKE